MKRHGAEDGYGGFSTGKRQREDGYQEALAAGKYELRLLVPGRGAGAVIGKGGDNIKRLRSDFDAHLSVPDSQTPERILTIVATIENVIRVVGEIIPRLEEVRSSSENRDRDDGDHLDAELRMLVHQSLVGAIIGRGGFRIKELREETGTQLKVYTQCCPQSTDRVIQISGSPEKVLGCVERIINMLKENQIKGVSKPYETIFYDPSFSQEYGGYPIDRNYRGPSSRSVGSSVYGGGPGRGPSYFYSSSRRSIGGATPFPPPYSGGPLQTTQVTIPNELGGTIIGKGGERINRIREDSGAHIVVEPQRANDERIITISGTQAQIQAAQYLLQQCVRSSVAGRKYLSEH
ncbi:hypothetical protein AB6A40_000120 [Gnathostoma spinigerum]|uniref:K Homology domain-containing protein n=1 Tax=Gnathostoma spinigerum TaxID=75299 RepID=A0ABD6E3F4_9BILA